MTISCESYLSRDPSDRVPVAAGLSRDYLLYHLVCPVAFTAEGTLVVATAPEALVPEALDELSVAYRRPVAPIDAPRHDVERLIARLTASLAADPIAVEEPTDDDTLVADVRDVAHSAPVTAYVNFLIGEALHAGASDIHLEATRLGLLTRFRVDGVLGVAPDVPTGLEAAVVSRLKIMAELDIAERRRPQDGRIRVRLADRELDVRASTVPTLYGESVVLRLLDRGGRPVNLDALGMPRAILDRMTELAQKPHGMVLVTGPTGSGKTTTLYAVLGLRTAAAEKIITIEDPIEYQLPGITQVPVHAQAGVTFATALRSILRQDPDVLMVGEMRDSETATLAVQAAMTGHLVLTTLHTNDALGAIPRLTDLGVPGYLVAATVGAVLAQRLVRRVCLGCRTIDRETHLPSRLVPAEVRTAALVRGVGCAACRGTGYQGRLGVFELVVVTDAMREAVTEGANRNRLHALAVDAGWRALADDAWTKVVDGLTTPEEVLRVASA